MVFVPKHAYNGLSLDLANHIHKTWRVGVPYEPDILVLRPSSPFPDAFVSIHRLEGSGNWFADNITG